MENHTNKQQISTPMAIVFAGFLIMLGLLLTRGSNNNVSNKSISEQVGVSKNSLTECIKNTDVDTLQKNIDDSVSKAMVNVDQRGTPYSVIIGKDGVKTDIRGADSYENVKKIVDDALIGKVTTNYTGNVPDVNSNEHIFGNPNATVTIIEYSDFECPYCKQFHPILKKIVQESNGNVRWVYRNFPLHQHSFEKLVAAECVSKLKGNDEYWKYADLLFGLLKTSQDSISDQL